MILGFKLTVAITGWAAIRDAALAARPDLERGRYRSPPHEPLVGPAVMAVEADRTGPGFRLVSAWTEQAPMTRHGGSKRYCYDVYGLGLLTDAAALLASVRDDLHEAYVLHDAFRLSVTRAGPGYETIGLAFLGSGGFDPVEG